MAEIMKTLTALSTGEKLQVVEFLCTALSSHYSSETPAWHDTILAKRENALDAEFEDWGDVKRELRTQEYAH